MSGSTQRTGQADTVLLLAGEKINGRTVSTKVIFQKLREDPDEYPLPVTFAIARDACGTPVLRLVDAVEDNRPLEQRILEQLEHEPKTSNALERTLGRSHAHVQGAITNLFSARAIRTTTVIVQGRSCKAFMAVRRGASGVEEGTE